MHGRNRKFEIEEFFNESETFQLSTTKKLVKFEIEKACLHERRGTFLKSDMNASDAILQKRRIIGRPGLSTAR